MKKLLVIMWVIVMLSGCVRFNQKMLPKVDIPKQENPAVIVEIQTGTFDTPSTGEYGVSGTKELDKVITTMMNRWKKKGLIADFGPTGKLDKKPDFTLIVSGARHEEGSGELAMRLCVYTLFIIPCWEKTIYDIYVELVNNKTEQHYFVQMENGLTMVMEIIFLPLSPTYWVSLHNMIVGMADYAYDELRKQGAFNRNRQ